MKDQHSRRGGFVRIFPRAETWSAYGGLLEYKTHTNELLASRLFPDTYRWVENKMVRFFEGISISRTISNGIYRYKS